MFDFGKKCLMVLIILFISVTVCQARQVSPVDVVTAFSADYGSARMDEAAGLTTDNFRAKKPKAVWVVETWTALRALQYRRISGSIVDSKSNDDRAAVIVDAKITTAAGETSQKEVYLLIKEGHDWFIDELQVTQEEIEIDAEKMRL